MKNHFQLDALSPVAMAAYSIHTAPLKACFTHILKGFNSISVSVSATNKKKST